MDPNQIIRAKELSVMLNRSLTRRFPKHTLAKTTDSIHDLMISDLSKIDSKKINKFLIEFGLGSKAEASTYFHTSGSKRQMLLKFKEKYLEYIDGDPLAKNYLLKALNGRNSLEENFQVLMQGNFGHGGPDAPDVQPDEIAAIGDAVIGYQFNPDAIAAPAAAVAPAAAAPAPVEERNPLIGEKADEEDPAEMKSALEVFAEAQAERGVRVNSQLFTDAQLLMRQAQFREILKNYKAYANKEQQIRFLLSKKQALPDISEHLIGQMEEKDQQIIRQSHQEALQNNDAIDAEIARLGMMENPDSEVRQMMAKMGIKDAAYQDKLLSTLKDIVGASTRDKAALIDNWDTTQTLTYKEPSVYREPTLLDPLIVEFDQSLKRAVNREFVSVVALENKVQQNEAATKKKVLFQVAGDTVRADSENKAPEIQVATADKAVGGQRTQASDLGRKILGIPENVHVDHPTNSTTLLNPATGRPYDAWDMLYWRNLPLKYFDPSRPVYMPMNIRTML